MLRQHFVRYIFLAMIGFPISAAFAFEVAHPETTETADNISPLNAASVNAPFPATDVAASSAPAVVQEVLHYALSQEGTPYRRGGSSPEAGFDCSGFVRHVFDHVSGIVLPHNASALSKIGSPVNMAELLPGDLVFFRRLKKHITHIGIYLGDQKFIHASSTQTGRVMISSLTERYWAKHFALARHLDPRE